MLFAATCWLEIQISRWPEIPYDRIFSYLSWSRSIIQNKSLLIAGHHLKVDAKANCADAPNALSTGGWYTFAKRRLDSIDWNNGKLNEVDLQLQVSRVQDTNRQFVHILQPFRRHYLTYVFSKTLNAFYRAHAFCIHFRILSAIRSILISFCVWNLMLPSAEGTSQALLQFELKRNAWAL